MRHPSVHDSLIYIARKREVITLSGLLFNYNAINPQARANGTIQTVNGQLKDQYVNGVWQNPYQTLTMVAISPSTTVFDLTSCQVKLPSSLFLSNIGKQVSSIYFNADDGRGYQLIQPDVPISLSYDSVGLKHWFFRVTLASGRQLYSHCKVYFNNTSNLIHQAASQASGAGSNARGTIVDQWVPIKAIEAYKGKAGEADLFISYRDANDQVLRRPLIVVEGFDPGHITSPEKPEGENTFKGFMTGIQRSGSPELRKLISDYPSINAISQYDVVYVNWRNGTDYLQRNMLVLEEAIRWVNNHKQPLGGTLQPNVVLGSSMGGVIARMALGRLDRAGGTAAHQTRLYVSLDAPHLGANVPLGYQAAARHAARVYIGTGPVAATVEVIQLIRHRVSPLLSLFLADQPAARQMLINRINILDQTVNADHQSFQQELRTTWAYPANIRNVAISDGSECAIDQEFTPGSTIFYNYQSIKTRFLGDLIGMMAGAGLGALGIDIPLVTPALAIPGSSQVKATLEIKSLAANGGNRVYYGNVSYTKKILWLVPLTVTITNHSYNAPTGLLALDSYPGGFYYLAIDQPSGPVKKWVYTYDNTLYVQHRFCFVPTASALDIGQGNVALGANDYLNRYVGDSPPAAPLNSPFANFTTAFNQNDSQYPFVNDKYQKMNNEVHEGLFFRSSNWLAAELNTTPLRTNCSAFCSNASYAIVGSSLVCNSADFRINNLLAGTSVTWSLPANTASAFQLQPNVPGPGQVRVINQKTGIVTTTLTATINTSATGGAGVNCSNTGVTLTTPLSNDNTISFPYYQEACTFYNVYHASQSGSASSSNSTFVHQGCRVYVNLGTIPRTVTLSSGGQPTTWGLGSAPYPNTLYFELPIGSGGVPFTFKVAGNGDCGDVSLVFFTYSNNARMAYEASPNPAANEVTVTAMENDPDASAEEATPKKAQRAKKPLAYTVDVYDTFTGALKMSQKNSNGSRQTHLNVSKLRPGYYMLHISDEEGSHTIRIYKE